MKKSFTILLLLLIAAPVSASSLLYGPESYMVTRLAPYSAVVEAQQFEALLLSFAYDAREFDTPTISQNDTLTYGITANGEEFILGTIKGINGLNESETGMVSALLPPAANETTFSIFARVSANTDSDVVRITNLEVRGKQVWDGTVNTPATAFQKAHGLVKICHFDDATEQFYKETVNIASIIKGKGHDQHVDDIIPLFWYVESRGGDVGLYGGNDWNKTNATLYLNECREGE
jgi:hypothetical protein